MKPWISRGITVYSPPLGEVNLLMGVSTGVSLGWVSRRMSHWVLQRVLGVPKGILTGVAIGCYIYQKDGVFELSKDLLLII